MTRIRFEDLPNTNTPRNAENLNKLNNVVISPTEPTTGEEVWIDDVNKKIYTKNDNDVYEEFYNEDNPINITTGVEYETGRIIDGKKEYGLRKNLGALPNDDAIDYTIGISDAYNITNYRLYAVKDNQRYSIPFFNLSAPEYYALGYVRGNVVPIKCTYDLSAYNLVVDITYTKN